MKRFRQYRNTQEIRDKYADVPSLEADTFIYPYFVVEGDNIKSEIKTLPSVFRFSIDRLLIDLKELVYLGIHKILLFAVIDDSKKDEKGTEGYKPDNLIGQTIKAVKKAYPQITIFTDVCLCEYTSHGHCGLIDNTDIDNDKTLPLLAEMAYQHALAGADFVAPSAMMDGQIQAIKERLTKEKMNTKILGYSAKYASIFYGPFREAAQSSPSFGDRKSYQMDYRTKEQGILEIEADIEEGADWVMVKPAMSYLDILYRASQTFPDIPLVAYQVSGEYAMLKAGASLGLFDEKNIFTECLTAIRRAGADYIITYYAKEYIKNTL